MPNKFTKTTQRLKQLIFYRSKNKGFQIMELAIVIAVMAMLTMGTFVTAEILEHAYERSIINQLKATQESFYLFSMAYSATPGDFSTASIDLPHDAKCNHATDTNGTLNGNGNGKIDKSATVSSNYTTESYWAWCHLYLANTGVPHYEPPTALTTNIIPGTHTPKTKRNAALGVVFLGDYDGQSSDSVKVNSNVIMIHMPDPTATTGTNDLTQAAHAKAVLTIKQAKNIIEKVDNGQPHSGGTFAANNGFETNNNDKCVKTDSAKSVFASNKGMLCVLIQKINI